MTAEGGSREEEHMRRTPAMPTGQSQLAAYEKRKARIADTLRARKGSVRLKKNTSSNLFRYRPGCQAERLPTLPICNHVLRLDPAEKTLEAEGMATYQNIVHFTLERGFLPTVAPELKHITLGGAIVGIGIESSCFRHGFVHDGVLEADVVLPDGKVITCTPKEFSDLFQGLPNSYGTLGYILRARIRLVPARSFVHLT